MAREMLINVSEGEECRIALLDGGNLQELYMERASSTSHVGNIYKGRVTNVEPSIQAAFVDFGLSRNGFLHISDLMPTYFGKRGEEIQETVGRKMARRDRPPIQRCLRRGDDIVVQIIKEGIGTKGPTLSTYLSVPGRILVMMPGMGKMGVSRKIEDEEERRRLRQILDGLKPPADVGFIIRTAGVGKTKAEIERDLKYLTRLWENIDKKTQSTPAPVELYTEGDLVTRTVRDVFSSDIGRIIIDNKDVARKVKEFFKIAMPRTRNKVELYEEPIPLFHKYGIEREIEQMYNRHVPLPSGGSLVIDSTEAIVAIDVNSGKFRDHSDAEMTAFKTDMEAADEICRQLKLRDLGGVIICDFIDLRYERHRRELEHRLHENLKEDRAKTKVLRMSQFGIIEMTRQRMRPSLKRSVYFDCPYCKGSGLVKTPESMSLDVMRRLTIAGHDARVHRVELSVSPDVSVHLQNRKRQQLAQLEEDTGKRVMIRADQTLGLDDIRFNLYDTRDGLVFLEELGMSPQALESGGGAAGSGSAAAQRGQRRSGGAGRRDDRFQRPPRHQQPTARQTRPVETEAASAVMDERYLLDAGEDAVEEREARIHEARPAARAPSSGAGAAAVVAAAGTGAQGEGTEAAERSDEDAGPRTGRRRGRRGRRGGRGHGGQYKSAEDASGGRDAEGRVESDAAELSADDRNVAVDRGPDREPAIETHAQRPDESLWEPGEEGAIDSGEETVEIDEVGGAGEVGEVGEGREVSGEGERESSGEREAEGEQGDEGASSKRRRRRRGGRRHRRSRSGGGGERTTESAEPSGVMEGNGQPAAEPSARRGVSPHDRDDGGSHKSEATTRRAAASAGDRTAEPPRIPQTPVVRTGSTDRHLVNDEPVHPEPVRRPRTYRDLDEIPEDFD